MALVDTVAKRYGQRPSTLLAIRDPWEALDVDIGIATVAMMREAGDLEKIKVPKGVAGQHMRGPAKLTDMTSFKSKMRKYRSMKLGH